VKKIKLTESDLERIIKKVIEEGIGDQISSRLSGLSAGIAARKHNRQVKKGDASGVLMPKLERNLASISTRAKREQKELDNLLKEVNNLITDKEIENFAEKQQTSDPEIASKISTMLTVFAEYKSALETLISKNNEIASLYQSPSQPQTIAPTQPSTPVQPSAPPIE
jgi:predicted DNA binding CopG/RHH family protein